MFVASTFEDRIYAKAREAFLSWADHQPAFAKRNKRHDPLRRNCIVVLSKKEGKHIVKSWLFGANLVTDDGEIYYAKKGAGETPATNENFIQGRNEFRTGAATPGATDTYTNVTTPVTASRKQVAATFPKSNDSTTENTGKAINAVTYKFAYSAGDFTATGIIGGCIHDNASPVGGTKLLCHYSITSFNVDAGDGLNFYVNHAAAGV